MLSLRQGLVGIGVSGRVEVWGSFGRRTPRSLKTAIRGMSDCELAVWTDGGVIFETGNEDGDSAQGVTSDGAHWILCSNSSQRISVWRGNQLVAAILPAETVLEAISLPIDDLHFGAPAFFRGVIYVPIFQQEGPGLGVWRIEGTSQGWLPASSLPNVGNLFSWCAIEPVTGLLYTGNPNQAPALFAYERDTMRRREADDIPLGAMPLPISENPQGGAFTPAGRVLLLHSSGDDGDNAIFCYSALNGFPFEARTLDSYSELESVSVVTVVLADGRTSSVQILDEHNWPDDCCTLHAFVVPDPSRL